VDTLCTRPILAAISEADYHQTVIRLMTDMRLDGELPFEWIVDETRRVRLTRTFETIERRLGELCKQLGCDPPIVERSALTEEQIEKFYLPTRPTKRSGNSHAKNFEGDSVELDALPPGDLRAMVREVIEQHVSPAVTEALRVAEESERDLLRAWRPAEPLVDEDAG
jgi:hypothetical protein